MSDFLIFDPEDDEAGVGSFFSGMPDWFVTDDEDYDGDEPPQDRIRVD